MKNNIIVYGQLLRLDRPIGFLLLLWPTLMALWLSSAGQPDPRHVLIFVLGVFVMRSAGCVINDIADRRLDAQVQRTRGRPLARGRVSLRGAWVAFGILLLMALGLVLQLNQGAFQVAWLAVGLTAVYPFCKRFTFYPQAVLGAAFACSSLMVYAARPLKIAETVTKTGVWVISTDRGEALLLFVAIWAWTVAYDTQYAMVDRPDDRKVGIKSTAVRWGDRVVSRVLALQALLCVLGALLGWIKGLQPVYYLALLGVLALFIYQYRLMKRGEGSDFFKAFLNNHWVGMLWFTGIWLSYA